MRRREFITFLGGAAVAGPLSSQAGTSAPVRRIGVLANEPWPALEGLHVGLDELGYGEGKDFLIEYRFAEGDARRFPELAAGRHDDRDGTGCLKGSQRSRRAPGHDDIDRQAD